MPHAALKIVDGVNTERTRALNEAGLSASQLIRFRADARDGLLVEKLGGWTRWYPNPTTAVARALWAWEDTEAVTHLAIGAQNAPGGFESQLNVVTGGVLGTITPRAQINNITAAMATTSGSSIVTITDAVVTDVTAYDAVYIATQVSIGGLVLFGMYPCNPDGHTGATTYTIAATDALGNPLAASGSSTTPTLPLFATTSGSTSVTVTLANHGYSVGSVFPVLTPTLVGGVTFFSHYPVQTVVDADTFTITGGATASATTTGSLNDDKASYLYSFALGAIPDGSGFGVGGFGAGGFGTGPGIAPSLGIPIPADDWTLDNWGELLVASPTRNPIVLTVTGAGGDGTTATLAVEETFAVPGGDTVTLSGMEPATWNGTYVVTASTANSVSFASALTSATGFGSVAVNITPFQPIYLWDAEAGAPFASVIPEAPPVNEGVFVAMPQRQMIAYGSTFTGLQDPLLLRWCDINNFGVWVGQTTNQAGSFRIPKGSRIVGAMQGPMQALLWTDLAVWSMQYIGQPLIYGFNEIATGCGLIGKKAAALLNGVVYWMGPSQFYVLTQNGVQTLPCDVWDVVYQQLDTSRTSRIRAATNSRFGEVAWYFPTRSSNGEVAMYVKYNAIVGKWDYGTLARSAWIDQSVLGPPIGADPSSLYLYQHETSPDADGQAMNPSFTTGYFALSDGDWKTYVDQVWPDFKYGTHGGAMNATLNLTFNFADYPGQAPKTVGPYAVTQANTYISPRFRGRLVSFTVSSNDVGSFWRVGQTRYRFAADGKFG